MLKTDNWTAVVGAFVSIATLGVGYLALRFPPEVARAKLEALEDIVGRFAARDLGFLLSLVVSASSIISASLSSEPVARGDASCIARNAAVFCSSALGS